MLENMPPNSSRKHDQDKGVEKNVTMSAVRAPDQLKILADTDETWLQVSTAERAMIEWQVVEDSWVKENM